MRHDLAARPVAVRPRGMGEAARAAGLVAPAGSPQRSAARLFGACPRAVDLPAVAVPANHHLRPTAGAKKHPACVGHRRLRLIAEARWTPCAADAILSAARVRLWPACGARRRVTCQGAAVVALALLRRADYPVSPAAWPRQPLPASPCSTAPTDLA